MSSYFYVGTLDQKQTFYHSFLLVSLIDMLSYKILESVVRRVTVENIEMNRKAVFVLAQWDPFKLGEDSYDTETADVVAALQGINDPSDLAKVIQRVYEHSFEQWIPLEDCVDIARKLIAIKYEAQCII